LCVAHYEHLPPPHRGAYPGELLDALYGGEEVRRGFIECGHVAGVLATDLQFVGAKVLQLVAQLLRRGPLRTGQGEEPVNIRMFEAPDQPTRLTRTTGAVRRGGGADQKLREPEPDALLADPLRSVEQDRLGEPAGAYRPSEPC